jgi:predicted nucleic acid-binding protein
MAAPDYLADASAFFRIHGDPRATTTWWPAVDRGIVGICEATEVEIFYTARSAEHSKRLKARLRDSYPWVGVPDSIWVRVLEVQQAMIGNGTHRSAGLADLVVAATAEIYGLTVLHDDRDFDCIAAITGQAVRRVWN